LERGRATRLKAFRRSDVEGTKGGSLKKRGGAEGWVLEVAFQKWICLE
jgi:hypothetical protein